MSSLPPTDGPPSSPASPNGLVNWVTGHGNFVKSLLTMIQIIAAVGAAVVLLVEYRQKIQDERVERALAYIHESRTEPLRGARFEIDTLFLEKKETETLKEAIIKTISDKNLCSFSKYIEEKIEENNLFEPLYSTTEFYTSVATCVESGLCDLEVSCDFLYRRMKSQRSTFCPFYDGWNVRWGQNVSRRIDQFLINCAKHFDSTFDPSTQPLFACDEISQMSDSSQTAAYDCE